MPETKRTSPGLSCIPDKPKSTCRAKRHERLHSILSHLAGSRNFAMGNHPISGRDKQVMAIDVHRCLAHWDIHRHIKIAKRIHKRSLLLSVLDGVSKRIERFRYYQGLHEVCLVVLEACQEDVTEATKCSVALLETGFHDFTHLDFQDSVLPLLDRVRKLVAAVDERLARCLSETGSEYHFVLPWVLTWFAHSLDSYDGICNVYRTMIEATIARKGDLIIYLCAAVLLEDSHRIMAHPDDTNHTIAMVQTSIRHVDIDSVIQTALRLFGRFPPDQLIPRCERRNRIKSPRFPWSVSWRTTILGVAAMTISLLIRYGREIGAIISTVF